MKRVVITGIGIVSCLGNNQDEVYKSLLKVYRRLRAMVSFGFLITALSFA